jgi:hypothetical protein
MPGAPQAQATDPGNPKYATRRARQVAQKSGKRLNAASLQRSQAGQQSVIRAAAGCSAKPRARIPAGLQGLSSECKLG